MDINFDFKGDPVSNINTQFIQFYPPSWRANSFPARKRHRASVRTFQGKVAGTCFWWSVAECMC